MADAGYIYGIQAGNEPIVKVGWALDPDKRVKDFQTGNHQQLTVLAMRPGSRKEEEALHKPNSIIGPYNVRGEWYELRPEVMEVYGGGRWWPGYVPALRRSKWHNGHHGVHAHPCPYCGQRSLISSYSEQHRSGLDPKMELYCTNSDCEIRTLVITPGDQGPLPSPKFWEERALPKRVLGAEAALLPEGRAWSHDNAPMTRQEYARGRRTAEMLEWDADQARWDAERGRHYDKIVSWCQRWWGDWVEPDVPKPASLQETEDA